MRLKANRISYAWYAIITCREQGAHAILVSWRNRATRATLRMGGAISSKKGGRVSAGKKKLCTECRSMRPLRVSRPGENRLPSNHKGPEKRGELTNFKKIYFYFYFFFSFSF